MKKLLLLFALCFASLAQAQYTAIPDVNFEKKLIELKLDDVQDGKVLTSNISSVTTLDVSFLQIANLEGIQDFISLTTLSCRLMELTNLDVSKNTLLTTLICEANPLANLDVSKNTLLTTLVCSNNRLANLDVSSNTALTTLECWDNQLTNLDVSKNTLLTTLNCEANLLANLDVSKNTLLTTLVCSNNRLANLDVSSNTALTTLECYNNQLTKLDVSSNKALYNLKIQNNKLVSLDLSNNKALFYLRIDNNQLTGLDVSNNEGLGFLILSKNKLTSLDVTNNKKLGVLHCSENQLTTLDISKNIYSFAELVCNDNQIKMLFAKNGRNLRKIEVKNNPIEYICIDEFNFDKVASYKDTAVINSYCSFTPGGTFYTIQGTSNLDADNNGCDAQDASVSNIKYNVTNGTTSGNFIANSSGNYSIPLKEGNYTITPAIENPSYFTVSPASFTANFPTQISPFVQDICITPNGVHHDLETILIPQGNAVPGFEANYMLTYKNKGNQTETGQITLSFDDNVMDFVSASTTPLKVESGLLTFEYSALQPFVSNNITLVFRMNKPTDTPALNDGNVLTFVATIAAATTDETQLDNVATLNQTVRNSYDPNDKTCLEGNVVTPDLIGQYVHYLIRFENTGTLEARNIVVKDMIDTAKFDVNSLVVTNTSHSCVTRISDTNKVEFIFENIDLPYDNATNDGYIAFKIKTLPSLVVGDTFSNTAAIFFDYNFPIITNEAKTTVQTLGTSDFAFDRYFSLYPNPTKDQLSLSAKSCIEVNSIGIYNTLGQLVLAIPNAQTVTNFDVSRLPTGTYFVKIATNKGMSTAKFIKE